ncbi:MAG: hypothetical protein NW215_00620 [Hyphomicrobiales bacterium]|nr:hypothetical protein [Hyphomicrobiales bacterium]
MAQSNNRPTHRAFVTFGEGRNKVWREIGAAWAHEDGEGFNVKLDLMPLQGQQIILRTPKVKTPADEQGEV